MESNIIDGTGKLYKCKRKERLEGNFYMHIKTGFAVHIDIWYRMLGKYTQKIRNFYENKVA